MDQSAVADPGFPPGEGANPRVGEGDGGWRRRHTILPNFPKNEIKWKEFTPLDLSMECILV